MSIIISSSGTSSLSNIPPSSSAQASPATAVTAQTLPQQSPLPTSGKSNEWLEKWGVPIGGMIMTGIIGYFSAILPLKDNINDNKTEISVAKKDIEYIKEDFKRIEADISKVPEMKSDIAIIQTKLDMTENKNKKK